MKTGRVKAMSSEKSFDIYCLKYSRHHKWLISVETAKAIKETDHTFTLVNGSKVRKTSDGVVWSGDFEYLKNMATEMAEEALTEAIDSKSKIEDTIDKLKKLDQSKLKTAGDW